MFVNLPPRDFVVFDLDETLFYTKRAVFDAYLEAGVRMPKHMYGQPWHAWLPQLLNHSIEDALEVHANKNLIYTSWIANGLIEPTSAFKVFRDEPCVSVATGSSRDTAKLLLTPNYDHTLALTEANWEDKAKHIAVSSHPRVLYIDDNRTLGEKIVRTANHIREAHTPSVSFIHYTDQSSDDLQEQINSWREH